MDSEVGSVLSFSFSECLISTATVLSSSAVSVVSSGLESCSASSAASSTKKKFNGHRTKGI